MLHFVWLFLTRVRRLFSRNEWTIRLLKLPVPVSAHAERGLIMVQIDGLSRRQLSAALKEGRMPFLARLMKKEHYKLHTLYTGLPSSTPAVQGELFYGVKTAVPAFSFFERHNGRVRRMYESAAARQCEARLAAGAKGLLTGGSSYSNVMTGGATEAHFCAAQIGWGEVYRAARPHVLPFLFLMYADIFIRTAVLTALELGLAIAGCVRGSLEGKDFWDELRFIPTRVAICVLLREVITAGAQIDAARGLPVIHLNYLGYDEQAHRRGPASPFAHWTLKGIDYSIARLWGSARRSARRDYDLWIHSDHGQETTRIYSKKNGKGVADVVRRAFGESPGAPGIVVTSMGPVGHVYFPQELEPDVKDRIARSLVAESGIPMVMAKLSAGRALVWTGTGKRFLPDEAAFVFGRRHPFLNELAEDAVRLCRHPDAGDLVLFGTGGPGEGMSFQSENGGHAGFGREELSAFVLAPSDIAAGFKGRRVIRPSDLRDAALHFLGRVSRPSGPRKRPGQTVRLMTYNVHSCVGMDGRHSPDRIARVIARQKADIVALQEVDVNCGRTGCVDQAALIAAKLEMMHYFHPSYHIADGKFGNAILSRYPINVLHSGPLPSLRSHRVAEPRGALSVSIDAGGLALHLVNTHLSIWPDEQEAQAKALCDGWLRSPDAPLVLCGDFNSTPGSAVYRRIGRILADAQVRTDRHRPRNTWFGFYPLIRIDHIFLDERLNAVNVKVPVTTLERNASDHLPLIADIRAAAEAGRLTEEKRRVRS